MTVLRAWPWKWKSCVFSVRKKLIVNFIFMNFTGLEDLTLFHKVLPAFRMSVVKLLNVYLLRDE
jgi:hypothetical protein